MTARAAKWQVETARKALDEKDAALDETTERAASLLGQLYEDGARFDREALVAGEVCTQRDLPEVVRRLKEQGVLVVGRERGAPLYVRRLPEGVAGLEE